jgi:spore germination cell wall hydrolase CwlJ-like protein
MLRKCAGTKQRTLTCKNQLKYIMRQIMKYKLMAILTAFALLASPVFAKDDKKIELFDSENYPEHYCLALNIYYETRSSNLADQAAVANVVINRTNDRRYPDTICGVVKQGIKDSNGNMIKNKCQFSWYCDGKDDIPLNVNVWVEAQMLAWQIVENGKYRGLTEGATHYHATYVSPAWAKDLQLIGRIGEHIFYRWEN